jgi:cyclopropane fatty-acyl-phospholipid synthase-like methyltransferase
MNKNSIKTMKLYSEVERIYNDLEAAGIGRSGPLKVSDLSAFDQYHYHGTVAVDQAIEALGLSAQSRVADIGSGIGGPARYIAEKTGCRVIAVELQPDLNRLAEELTARCGLSGQITHVCGDVLQVPIEAGAYDAAVSWLALYHIADHQALLAKIHGALKPSGGLYAEDICSRGPFTAEEQELVSVKLFGQYMPGIARYRQDLEVAGFAEIDIEDMSDDWARFTQGRMIAFEQDREKHLAVHGAATVANLEEFYGTVDRLFQGGNLGGLRVHARKGA